MQYVATRVCPPAELTSFDYPLSLCATLLTKVYNLAQLMMVVLRVREVDSLQTLH